MIVGANSNVQHRTECGGPREKIDEGGEGIIEVAITSDETDGTESVLAMVYKTFLVMEPQVDVARLDHLVASVNQFANIVLATDGARGLYITAIPLLGCWPLFGVEVLKMELHVCNNRLQLGESLFKLVADVDLAQHVDDRFKFAADINNDLKGTDIEEATTLTR